MTPTSDTQLRGNLNLLAIVLAIILAVVAGLVYGRTMWLASGGPAAAAAQLKEAAAQKRALIARQRSEADAAVSPQRRRQLLAEASRLESHLPKIERELARLDHLTEAVQQQRPTTRLELAALAWEVTDFIGDLFLQALKLLVVPLVVTSMVCGITSLGDVRKIGRLGGWTVAYYLITSAVAVLIGIILVLAIRPGRAADDTFAYVSQSVAAKEGTTAVETLLNVFRGREDDPGSGMFPQNLILAASQTNVLALIVFALAFGAALTTLGQRGDTAVKFFDAANEAVMKMVHVVILAAPVGIFGLVVSNIARHGGAEGFSSELLRLGRYVATVLVGLGVHAAFLLVLIGVGAGRNPLVYTYNLLRAILTAISTASSSATLPVTMECTEQANNVSPRIANFVLPLGATVNMNGTALYESVAAIFIAQSNGIELGIGQLLVVFFTATLAAIGAAGIPEAGLVTMVIVLTAAGLPVQGIGTILAIDWFLDRIRTGVNIFGDAVGAGVIDRLLPVTDNASIE